MDHLVKRYDTTNVSHRSSFFALCVVVIVIAEAVQHPATEFVQSFDNSCGMERPVGQEEDGAIIAISVIRYHGIRCRVGYDMKFTTIK